MATPTQQLRDLFESGEHFIAADAYSALTARVVERVGFKAAYLGGHACSAFHYAMPDNGIFSQVEQLEQAGRIAAAINIPLIADADTLGETAADAFHFARRYARAGIAGIHVEDETNPKHSTYNNNLASIPDMQFRLEAAKKGGGESGPVLIARCDELYTQARRGGGGGSMDEAIKRGKAYLDAGADALVFPMATPEQTMEIKAATKAPIVVLGLPIPDTNCTLYTGWGWVGAVNLHIRKARQLMETGKVDMSDMVIEGKDALIEQDLYDELTADWARKTGRPTR